MNRIHLSRMRSERASWPKFRWWYVALVGLVGCSSRPGAVDSPSVSPASAAKAAIGQYDQDGDGVLNSKEILASGALVSAVSEFDTDGDGGLSRDEIQAGLERMFEPRMVMSGLRCGVYVGSRPLPDAKVRMIPEEFLGSSFPTAEGITDGYGSAAMASTYPNTAEQIDAVAGGLYRVEITSERVQLPTKYNSESELGCVINFRGRGDPSPTFNLSLR